MRSRTLAAGAAGAALSAWGALSAQAPAVSKDFTIGCESCGGAVQFGSVFELAVSPNGDVLVADRDSPMLRLFDGTGKATWSGGTKGRGPGEYQLVLRAAFTAGGLTLLDMANSRITQLSAAHAVTGTHPLGMFVTTTGANAAGTFVLAAEGALGTLRALQWRNGATAPVALPAVPKPADGAAFKNSSIAIAPNGTVAVLANNERYEVMRIDSAGARLGDITRAIARVRRTPVEEATLRERIARGAARVADEARKSGRGAGAAPAFPASELSTKAHATVDAMRYDPEGRLWIHTMRGDDTRTVFDVFAASGAFLGSVTVPGQVQAFALGGRWLVTARENDDGVPEVTRWTVR